MIYRKIAVHRNICVLIVCINYESNSASSRIAHRTRMRSSRILITTAAKALSLSRSNETEDNIHHSGIEEATREYHRD